MRNSFKSHFDTVCEAWLRERPDLELRNMLLALGLMRMGKMIDYAYDKRCREHFGITGAEMRILLALRRSGKPFDMRPTDLFKALLVTSGAVTKQVGRLARKLLVCRLDDPTHRGGSLVQLTREGLHVVDEATDGILCADSVLNPAMSKLASGERDAGERFVRFLISELESMHLMDPEDAVAHDVRPDRRLGSVARLAKLKRQVARKRSARPVLA